MSAATAIFEEGDQNTYRSSLVVCQMIGCVCAYQEILRQKRMKKSIHIGLPMESEQPSPSSREAAHPNYATAASLFLQCHQNIMTFPFSLAVYY
jgi:hypothetical protein